MLAELVVEMHEKDGGFIPAEAWTAIQKAFALPYIELLFMRRREGVLEFLLTHREDEHWSGWHIPGGIWRTAHTLEQAAQKLAKQELGADIALTVVGRGGWDKWGDHPYGNPISHVCICTAQDIVESDSIKWFSKIPDGMIHDGGHHVSYIADALKQVEAQKLL